MRRKKDWLIDEVMEQMETDIFVWGDWTAIRELLKDVPNEKLEAFLSEKHTLGEERKPRV